MSDDVIRVKGPSSDGERYRWKPRLSSSEPVSHARSTARSRAAAVNDISLTAVVHVTKFENSDVLPEPLQSGMHAVTEAGLITRSGVGRGGRRGCP